ncbi:MAG: hypothetical protein JYX80_11470 [Candidatus Scalindua sediminis]|nr:hypothetical protein [Candidatus Scalindua sediminis]
MTKILGAGELTKRLKIPYRKLSYLFESEKLRHEDFDIHAGRRAFNATGVEKVKRALKSINVKAKR